MPVPGLPRYLTRERETRLDGKGGATFFPRNQRRIFKIPDVLAVHNTAADSYEGTASGIRESDCRAGLTVLADPSRSE